MTLLLILSMFFSFNANASLKTEMDEEEKAIASDMGDGEDSPIKDPISKDAIDISDAPKDLKKDIKKTEVAPDKSKTETATVPVTAPAKPSQKAEPIESTSEKQPTVISSDSPSEIKNIRTAWYTREARERIVVDLSGKSEPAAYKKKVGDTISINIESGIDENKAEKLSKLLQKTHFINSAQIISLEDEKETLIQILVKKNVEEKVLTLSNPSRVVIDLQIPSKKHIFIKKTKMPKKLKHQT